jgi:hypothetical protein
MPIPSTIESLSTTVASNGPSGSDQRNTADDGLRTAYAFIRMLVTQGGDIASASSITPASTGSVYDITGTTAITALASTNSWDGRRVLLQFDGALTLTHSSNLALPGSANITTAAGDVAEFVQRGSGAWRCISYLRAAGTVPSLTAVQSLSGSDVIVRVENTSNTASSGARTSHVVAGSSGGDAYSYYTIQGATDWTAGIDNSDSDTYKISSHGTPGSGTFLALTTDGRLYGSALHDNGGSLTGTTNQYIASGTYTPTATAVTNVSSCTGQSSRWVRVGNVVTVSGVVTVDPASATTSSQLDLSLPIASALSGTELSGIGTIGQGSTIGQVVAVIGDNSTDDRASMFWVSGTDVASRNWNFQFQYTVV